ncbi:molecular chaperone DnaJ [Halopseudomonas nanhaiensis]|uniref:DNA-J related domain-containing protein n=1 Tax=Halopseudomonas nanhaiensis TaxID=2830842 RepID=UPI001CC0A100|nr:DNA-J related domain-containing protein [Halopseudomonas nanhaiensis]UAW97148.1 molecular chaperone DnaJ [Halopseudomonas nanhaiensis]
MTTVTSEQLLPEGFDALLLEILQESPDGTDEFGLIRRIAQERPDSLFAAPGALRDPLKLFQLHFLLFHTLYRLSDTLAASGIQVHIHALRIAIEHRSPSAPGLTCTDPLRAYYLDWSEWARTHEADVQRLLDSFWRGHQQSQPPDDDVDAALMLFELEAPVDRTTIRKRYRQLVSKHHPDRGGDTERLQAINAALLILERYYPAR